MNSNVVGWQNPEKHKTEGVKFRVLKYGGAESRFNQNRRSKIPNF